jgi:hypothetical protein
MLERVPAAPPPLLPFLLAAAPAAALPAHPRGHGAAVWPVWPV